MNVCARRREAMVLALCLLTALPVFSQSPAPIDLETAYRDSVMTAVRTEQPVTIDGRLDEPAWERAIPGDPFTQRLPNPGLPAVEQTQVRVLYDDRNLYVGVRAFDSVPAEIRINDLERDFNFQNSDSVTVAIDSLGSGQTGFTFRTNPGGAKAEAQVANAAYNNDWDAVWDVKTTTDSEGWIAEYVIPFKTLRFSRAPRPVWGFAVGRRLLRTNEESSLVPIPIRYNLARPFAYGRLEGLENIQQGPNLNIKPFVIGGVSQVRPPGAANLATERNFDGGVDLKYGLTPSLTLDATYRTDFAQVEVDQQQVNLTRFNLFFPEKREFFLENSSTFDFGAGNNLIPFFSRRIGLSADGAPIPIVGGARMTGEIDRFDVGFLTMQTESVGLPGEAGFTPANTYTVGRFKRKMLTNSWVGALVTSRDSELDGDYNRVYGADAHFLFDNRLEFDLYLLQSATPGPSGPNQARQLQAAWRDDELVIVAGYHAVQTGFNPEVGFIRRRDNTLYNGELTWSPRIESSRVIRNFNLGSVLEYYESENTGQIETRVARLNLGAAFENNSSITFSVIQNLDRLTEPFAIRPNISIGRGDHSYQGYALEYVGNPGAKLSGSGTLEWGEFWNGDRTSLGGTLSWKPNMHLKIDTNVTHNDVRLADGNFTTDLVGARLTYAFNPRAFLKAFIQYNADTGQISSNVRFNLIHRPLSDVFLVYNDLRETSGGQVLQRAVTLKVTNLFGF